MPIGLFGFLGLVLLGAGIAIARIASWRTLSVLAAVSAALASACVLAPWQGWQKIGLARFSRSEAWVTVESWTGLDAFRGGWVIFFAGFACVVAATFATREAIPFGRSAQTWALTAALALGASAAFTAWCLLHYVDTSSFEGHLSHEQRQGVAELGIHVTLLTSGFGFLCMLGVFLRLFRGVPGRE
jgi:hypothetical protein